ncbi:hypothetical protein ACFQV2_04375 [Actinokineospora soli]|uniref:Uncharacterized protein n=1 Tax=Actinokineospora soli TaxID=1048753 RepID=A0ABW2TH50_9PSEU
MAGDHPRPAPRRHGAHPADRRRHQPRAVRILPRPPPGPTPTAGEIRAACTGLDIVTLAEATCRLEFHDIAAVVHFLRKVIWTVPDFTVEKYRPRLKAMHDHITTHGSFISHSRRVLVEARKPG